MDPFKRSYSYRRPPGDGLSGLSSQLERARLDDPSDGGGRGRSPRTPGDPLPGLPPSRTARGGGPGGPRAPLPGTPSQRSDFRAYKHETKPEYMDDIHQSGLIAGHRDGAGTPDGGHRSGAVHVMTRGFFPDGGGADVAVFSRREPQPDHFYSRPTSGLPDAGTFPRARPIRDAGHLGDNAYSTDFPMTPRSARGGRRYLGDPSLSTPQAASRLHQEYSDRFPLEARGSKPYTSESRYEYPEPREPALLRRPTIPKRPLSPELVSGSFDSARGPRFLQSDGRRRESPPESRSRDDGPRQFQSRRPPARADSPPSFLRGRSVGPSSFRNRVSSFDDRSPPRSSFRDDSPPSFREGRPLSRPLPPLSRESLGGRGESRRPLGGLSSSRPPIHDDSDGFDDFDDSDDDFRPPQSSYRSGGGGYR
jgi:hypothetical protein